MTRKERATAADELFGIKDQLTDNSYITIMNLLSGKKTTPDFERAKIVRLKSHVFRYKQTFHKKRKLWYANEYDNENMDISVETHILDVLDHADVPYVLCDCGQGSCTAKKTITREYLRDLYDVYTKKCDCGDCYYIKQSSVMFWRPIELEIF